MILTDFRKSLANIINTTNLPIDAVFFVVKDIYNEVADLYKQQIDSEAAAATAQEPLIENKEEQPTVTAQTEEVEKDA